MKLHVFYVICIPLGNDVSYVMIDKRIESLKL